MVAYLGSVGGLFTKMLLAGFHSVHSYTLLFLFWCGNFSLFIIFKLAIILEHFYLYASVC